MYSNISIINSVALEKCQHNEYDYLQFVLVVYVGTPVAFLGILCNICLFSLLLYPTTPARMNLEGRNNSIISQNIYFLVLVCLDVCICSLYLLLFSIDALAEYLRIEQLWRFWISYVLILLSISRIVQLFSTYVIIVASWERYYAVVEATSYSRSQESNTSTIQDKVDIYNCCLVKNSKSKIYCKLIAVLVIVTLLRLPCFFEYEHEIRPQCIEIDFLASVDFKPLIINNDFYKTVYNFYFMNTVQVFAPMCMLSILNSMIVYKLQRQKNLAKKLVALFMETRIRKTILQKIKDTSEIRIAAYRMAAIVLTYIICNSLHLFLSIMEYACKQVLLEDENGAPTPMYNYLVDVVSLLFMFNSFLRLFIHLAINGTLRRDFKVMMFSILNIKYNFEALPSSEI